MEFLMAESDIKETFKKPLELVTLGRELGKAKHILQSMALEKP
jgi:hypothetical protein